jgi:hypothetical protein
MTREEIVNAVYKLNGEQQLEWLADLGMFLTIAARSGYPIQGTSGSLLHLVAFNEMQHAVYGCMQHLRDGTAWPMETFLDGLMNTARARGAEQDASWAISHSVRRLRNANRAMIEDSELAG